MEGVVDVVDVVGSGYGGCGGCVNCYLSPLNGICSCSLPLAGFQMSCMKRHMVSEAAVFTVEGKHVATSIHTLKVSPPPPHLPTPLHHTCPTTPPHTSPSHLPSLSTVPSRSLTSPQ